MLKPLEQILRSNDLVRPGDSLLVAVSGGADSMALLHLLSHLAPHFPFRLTAAHLDHQLRPESSDDADFVERRCQQLNVPLIVESVDVASLATELGSGIEDAGRQARRAFFERVADDKGCHSIVLAHHADDQAETVLFRLLRGSGLSGLAAMRQSAPPYIRPLLNFNRVELREYLQQNDLEWRDDASNEDMAFIRNRIRHQLLPQLEQYNPQVVEALNRLSHQAADEEEYWDTLAASFIEAHGRHTTDGFELCIEPLMLAGRAERRRILRSFLRQAKDPLAGIDFDHIGQIEDLLESDRPQASLDLPGVWVGRRYNRLLCSIEAPKVPEYEMMITGSGEYALPTGERLQVSVGRDLEQESSSVLFSAAQVPFPLTVRTFRSGDRFQPSGMSGRKRLKDYFIDAKIDSESRSRTPVVCCGDVIIWLAGRRRCDQFRPSAGENLLKITLLK